MSKSITLIPAYGRDYKSKKAAIADFEAGKDFIVCDMFNPYDGKPANRFDLLRDQVKYVKIRYYNKTRVVMATLRTEPGYEAKYTFA